MREAKIIRIDREVEEINKSLKDIFSVDVFTGFPIFRIVWSDDQMEKRYGTFHDYSGDIFIRSVTEVRLVPKYRQWIQQRYILERLVAVPESQQIELAGMKMSYENLWTFENSKGYLPPTFQAAKFIIDTVLSAQAVAKAFIVGNESIDRPVARYIDPDSSEEAAKENQKKRIDSIVEELFGDQSSLGGSTYVTKDTIIVPRNFERNK